MTWLIAMMLAASTPTTVSFEAAIHAAMADSAAGWNAGDLARFVALYADDAVFVTAKGPVQGRTAIAARYAKSFANGGNVRGRLTFGDERYRALGPRHEILWARWTLTAAAGGKVETGMTTLVFERRREGWRIVSDHRS